MKSGFTCKCGCSVCFSPSFLSCQLPLKAIRTRHPNQPLPHDFLCYTINRSIYIAFHGWALSQYFRGPTVNWPLIIYCSLVHLILHIAHMLRYDSGFTKTRSVFLICSISYILSVPMTKVSFLCVSWVMLVTWARFKHVIPPCVQSGGQMTEAKRSWSPVTPFCGEKSFLWFDYTVRYQRMMSNREAKSSPSWWATMGL